MNKQLTSRLDKHLLLYSFLIAFGFLSICSKSSFLYPMNDWVDVNCFFTMGRSIWDGLVPYRDLYEQKGPVLYFLYAFASLISSDSFFGVFVLEVVTFGLFLYFSGRIAQLCLNGSKLSYLIVAFLAALIPVSPAFSHGSSCEETCLFFLAYGLYSVTLALTENRPLTFWESFINGVFAAAVLYIKFTMMGFYGALAVFVIFWYCTRPSHLKKLLSTIGGFIAGIVALSLPVYAYFALNGAVDDFITVYFHNNLFLYPAEFEGTRRDMIVTCLEKTLALNKSYSWLFRWGSLYLILDYKNWRSAVMVSLTYLGLAIGTYWGGRGYTYYGLILCIFAVYGLIGFARLLQLIPIKKIIDKLPSWIRYVNIGALALAIVLLFNYSCKNSRNSYLLAYSKEEMPAYRFAATIRQTPNAKILNYGFLDAGFYFASDVTPNCRYFCTLNLNTAEMWAEQKKLIEGGQVDFIITRRYTLDRYSPDSSKYVCIDQVTMPFEGVNFTYYLYQKRPGA